MRSRCPAIIPSRSSSRSVADELETALQVAGRRRTWWRCAATSSGWKWKCAPTSCSPSGVANLSNKAIPALDALAIDARRSIRTRCASKATPTTGPISTQYYPSNWELSAARAASVVHRFARGGLSPDRLSVIGFGEYRPAKPNDTLAGRDRESPRGHRDPGGRGRAGTVRCGRHRQGSQPARARPRRCHRLLPALSTPSRPCRANPPPLARNLLLSLQPCRRRRNPGAGVSRWIWNCRSWWAACSLSSWPLAAIRLVAAAHAAGICRAVRRGRSPRSSWREPTSQALAEKVTALATLVAAHPGARRAPGGSAAPRAAPRAATRCAAMKRRAAWRVPAPRSKKSSPPAGWQAQRRAYSDACMAGRRSAIPPLEEDQSPDV